MTEKNERWKRRFDETVDYEQTVRAIIAFTALVVHDGQNRRPDSQFGLGRRMSRLPKGPDVTPDLVAQKSTTYGVAAEVKKSLGKDETHWMRCVEQAVKYRGRLLGWFTRSGSIDRHDAVVLVHLSRSRKFARFIDKEVAAKTLTEPGIALVEFSQSDETASYYFFRLERGTISDPGLSASLDSGTQVPLAGVLKSFPNVRYYDSPAPMPLLLTHLWTDLFPPLAMSADYDEKSKSRRIRVSIKEVTEELQRAYGSSALHRDDRSACFPRLGWVQTAFQRLVKFGLARPVDGADHDQYDVYHRGFRKDVREHFCHLEAKLQEPEAKNEVQPSLLDGLQIPEVGPPSEPPNP